MKEYHVPLLVQALQWAMGKGMQADRAIEQLFRNHELNGTDKRILHENFYDIIRWWRLLVAVNNNNASLQDDNLARIVAINLVRKGRHVPAHPAMGKINPRSVERKLEEACQTPALAHSLPDWMEERCAAECGADWEPLATALNQAASLVLRVNTLKAGSREVEDFIQGIGAELHRSDIAADGLVLDDFINPYRTMIFREGWIEVQDEGSQRVSEFAGVKPGQRVVDACAGAGGKSLHLAALMKNKGKIIALDIFPQKLEELKRRARRAGAENIEVRLMESSKTVKRMQDTADVVLIDAPCSGLGVLRRNPDIKWRLQPEEMIQLEKTQQELLHRFSIMVKPGGVMVYATCSILPTENEVQVTKFLETHPGFELEEEEKLLPHTHGCDGFYMARLIRKK